MESVRDVLSTGCIRETGSASRSVALVASSGSKPVFTATSAGWTEDGAGADVVVTRVPRLSETAAAGGFTGCIAVRTIGLPCPPVAAMPPGAVTCCAAPGGVCLNVVLAAPACIDGVAGDATARCTAPVIPRPGVELVVTVASTTRPADASVPRFKLPCTGAFFSADTSVRLAAGATMALRMCTMSEWAGPCGSSRCIAA